jgi:hypothetical protein
MVTPAQGYLRSSAGIVEQRDHRHVSSYLKSRYACYAGETRPGMSRRGPLSGSVAETLLALLRWCRRSVPESDLPAIRFWLEGHSEVVERDADPIMRR